MLQSQASPLLGPHPSPPRPCLPLLPQQGLTPGDFELMQQALAPLGLTPDMLFGSMLGGAPGLMPGAGRLPGEAAGGAAAAGGRGANWSDGDAAGALAEYKG